MGCILGKGHIIQTIGMSEITRFVTTSLLNSFAHRGGTVPKRRRVPAGWSGVPCQVTLTQLSPLPASAVPRRVRMGPLSEGDCHFTA